MTGILARAVARVRAALIADVPPELDECESCRETECTHERAETCGRRRQAMGDAATEVAAEWADAPTLAKLIEDEEAGD
jgi:hypothetical protein